MLEDLCTDIAQWSDLGDKIVLMIELIENITSNTVPDIFSNVGLKYAIITHCHSVTGMVSTYQRESHAIDSIYTLRTLQVSTGGYLPFVIISSDHQLLWLKIDFYSAFGTKIDTL